MPNRRKVLGALGSTIATAMLPGSSQAARAQSPAGARVVVVGGGFGGATAARFAKRANPSLEVTLVEANPTYSACPFSNLVVVGRRNLEQQQFHYKALARAGVKLRIDRATAVDAQTRRVRLAASDVLEYDRLILAPGIDLQWNAIEGYDEAASQYMPHAWQAGAQTLLLKHQLEAMADGGLVVIAVPDNPYRCPPGPYERASLIANYLKHHKPRSKLLLLDAKDQFSKKALFQSAWTELYGDLIEWQGLSDGGRVIRVDAKTNRVFTDFDTFDTAVCNLIPPQRAGAIATAAGVTNASGWCPIDPVSFESTLVPGIHVIGDAAIANAMPKSAFAANAQAKICAVQVARLLNGEAALSTTLANTCYSLVAPDYGISVAGVYRPGKGALQEVSGAGGVSPAQADAETRALEAGYAHEWFTTITTETFG